MWNRNDIRRSAHALLRAALVLPLLLAVTTWTASAQEPIPPGTALPAADQALANVEGGQTRLADVLGAKGTVVVFWSNQCPWVDKTEERFITLIDSRPGVNFVLVNANDPGAFPKESLTEGAARLTALRGRLSRSDKNTALRYLRDDRAAVARAFGAERTPHVFVFDAGRTLVYAGSIDDSPGDPANVQQSYLRDALVGLDGGGAAQPVTKAFGCTIKAGS